jgi:cytochrome c peroxidase
MKAILSTALILLGFALSSGTPLEVAPASAGDEYSWAAPEGFEPMPVPADNPMSQEKVALGHQLYFDTRLSGDGVRSCYSCHVVENGLTDGRPTALGAFDKPLSRAAPTMWNVGYHDAFYWDGRTPTLEKQVLGAWKGGNMGAAPDEIVAQLDKITAYHEQFQSVFGTKVTVDGVQKAVAAYMRTLICGDTAFDRWQQGDSQAVSAAAKRGWDLFRGKAACGTCHAGALLTDLQYHNVGVGMSAESPDIGRGKISNEEKDTGAFKTPTLRNVSRTAPYFHNGQAATLREAVDFMLGGGFDNPHLDRENLKAVELSDAEIFDLIAFLGALDCDASTIEYPALPE